MVGNNCNMPIRFISDLMKLYASSNYFVSFSGILREAMKMEVKKTQKYNAYVQYLL